MYSRWFLIFLGLPGLVWFGIFVIGSLYALVAIAAGGVSAILSLPVPAWNPEDWNAAWLLQIGSDLIPPDGVAWITFTRTCLYIFVALTGCVAIGYPVAYYVAIHAGKGKGFYLVLLVMPFLVSYMLRMLAWIGLLAPGGWVDDALVHLHLIDHPINWLAGLPVTVVLSLIYGWVPYFIIPLYASLSRFDLRYLEASCDLGGSPFRTFIHVTLPLSRHGLMAAMVIVLLPMFGDFFTNALMSGSTSTSMVGSLIYAYSLSDTQQPLAPAAAVWLMVFLGILVVPYLRSSSRPVQGSS